MVHYEIIDFAVGREISEFIEILAHFLNADGVDESYLIGTGHYIGIIAHSVGEWPESFELMFHTVVYTDIEYVVCYLLNIHK